MHSCKQNPPDAGDPNTVKKYFNLNGPYLGYFLSERDEIFNITSIYADFNRMFTNNNINAWDCWNKSRLLAYRSFLVMGTRPVHVTVHY